MHGLISLNTGTILRDSAKHTGLDVNTQVENFKGQLVKDMDRYSDLIVRYAAGEREVRRERDRLKESIEVRIALLPGRPSTNIRVTRGKVGLV